MIRRSCSRAPPSRAKSAGRPEVPHDSDQARELVLVGLSTRGYGVAALSGYNPPLVLLRKRQLAGLGYLSGVIWICACGGGAADEAGDSGSTTVGLTTADLTTADLTTGDGPTDSTPTEAGEPFPGCDGLDLEQDGALDLDIVAIDYVSVSGAIRVNGGALPDANGTRGAIVFETTPPVGLPGAFTHTLGSAGAEDYSLVLPAGVVAVRYVPDADLCAASPEGPLPCTGGVLLAGVNIVDDGVLDLDIPSVLVTGKVTQNGAALPDEAGDRGHIEFTRATGELMATEGFGATGAASYAAALFPGTYDVSFAGNPGLCGAGAAKVPCNRGVLQEGVVLEASGALDVDVPKVDITGFVTVNGSPIADGPGERGALRLRPTGPAGAGELRSATFSAAGPVEYALSLVAGTYDIELAADPAQCSDEPPVIPCVSGVLLPAVKLLSSGALDVDVPMIEVSGKVTLRGATLPDAPGDRGSLQFAQEAGEAFPLALGAAGSVDYLLGVIPGKYAIRYAAAAAACDGDLAPDMPCIGGLLQTVDLALSGVLDVDIPAIEVGGAVTLNGVALKSQPTGRGSLLFASGADGSLAVPLGSDGAGDYALTLLPGKYDVTYVAEGPCLGAPDSLMPCGGGRLLAGVGLAMDGVLDVDIPAIGISGAVTYASAALPELEAARGSIGWTRVDGAGALALDLGADGAVQYEVLLMPGRWVIDHSANPELCADSVPDFPCSDQVIFGCSMP